MSRNSRLSNGVRFSDSPDRTAVWILNVSKLEYFMMKKERKKEDQYSVKKPVKKFKRKQLFQRAAKINESGKK